MKDIVIAEAVRSAVGRAHKGSLAQTRPDEFAADVVAGLIKRVPQVAPQDVEDIAADVWLVTLGSLANLRPRAGRLAPVLITFLGTTVLQKCNNFLRSRARQGLHREGAGVHEAPPAISQLPAETLGVVTRAVRRDLGSAVGRCLQELSQDKRDVLVLRLMEHRTNQEIGELFSIPANTVAVRYKRALEELRTVLPPDVFEDIQGAVD